MDLSEWLSVWRDPGFLGAHWGSGEGEDESDGHADLEEHYYTESCYEFHVIGTGGCAYAFPKAD